MIVLCYFARVNLELYAGFIETWLQLNASKDDHCRKSSGWLIAGLPESDRVTIDAVCRYTQVAIWRTLPARIEHTSARMSMTWTEEVFHDTSGPKSWARHWHTLWHFSRRLRYGKDTSRCRYANGIWRMTRQVHGPMQKSSERILRR